MCCVAPVTVKSLQLKPRRPFAKAGLFQALLTVYPSPTWKPWHEVEVVIPPSLAEARSWFPSCCEPPASDIRREMVPRCIFSIWSSSLILAHLHNWNPQGFEIQAEHACCYTCLGLPMEILPDFSYWDGNFSCGVATAERVTKSHLAECFLLCRLSLGRNKLFCPWIFFSPNTALSNFLLMLHCREWNLAESSLQCLGYANPIKICLN